VRERERRGEREREESGGRGKREGRERRGEREREERGKRVEGGREREKREDGEGVYRKYYCTPNDN
jgi:hypothetical protein